MAGTARPARGRAEGSSRTASSWMPGRSRPAPVTCGSPPCREASSPRVTIGDRDEAYQRAFVEPCDPHPRSSASSPDGRNDVVGMALHLHLRPYVGDLALGVDQERLPFRREPQHLPRTEGVDDDLLGVGDHREGHPELVDELALDLRLVRTDAHNEGVQGLQVGLVLLEVLRFVGSTRRVRPG